MNRPTMETLARRLDRVEGENREYLCRSMVTRWAVGQRLRQSEESLPVKTITTCIFVLILLTPIQVYTAQSILVCTFSYVSTFDPKGQNDVVAKVHKQEPWSVIFAGLDSGTPKIKGNLGESSLKVIRSDPSTIWLTEEPPLGGVNLWTIFLDTRTAILSKQYRIVGTPFGMMAMGRCK